MSTAQNLLQVIENTPVTMIPDLDIVKNKYIQNYNATHREKIGDLMYHRQVVFLKQAIMNNPKLQEVQPFSLYAVFATASIKGYSLDPGDNEVYIYSRDGKAVLDLQAGAYVRRLITTDQVRYAQQAVIVYEFDIFRVSKGFVLEHERQYKSDKMIAAFVIFILDEKGTERHFIYDRADWETWRAKSPMKNGSNWNTNNNPLPGFLRTKVVKHAATERCWATGDVPASIEQYAGVEIDTEDIPHEVVAQQYVHRPAIQQSPVQQNVTQQMPQQQANPVPVNDDFDTATTTQTQNSVNHSDDDF